MMCSVPYAIVSFKGESHDAFKGKVAFENSLVVFPQIQYSLRQEKNFGAVLWVIDFAE